MGVDGGVHAAGSPGMHHPALLYRNQSELLDDLVPFVRDGIDRGEPVLVAIAAEPLEALSDAVGSAVGLALVDTAAWCPEPVTRLRAFHDHVTSEVSAGAPAVRLVSEAVWPAADVDLEREWQRYESAVNEVLAPFPVSLVCTYDLARLPPSIPSVARRTHPFVRHGTEDPSEDFEEPADFLRRWTSTLGPVPGDASALADPSDLPGARRFLLEQAMRAGLGRDRTADLCVAANEVLTNAIVHAGGPTGLSAWIEHEALICQIDDAGAGISDPIVGYRPPPATAERGRGLWLARQLVDLIQISPGDRGTSVRLRSGRR